MLTIGFLFTIIGIVLVLFNTIDFKFVQDQVKNKKQALVGYVLIVIGVILFAIAVKNLMLVE